MQGRAGDDEHWMAEALSEADVAARHGDVPVGAVVVYDGRVIGRGHNRRVVDDDPLAHAEVLALRDAAQTLGSWRLDGATLYVTLEPCPMCAGALVQARVATLVYGTDDVRGGAVRSLYQVCDDRRQTHRMTIRHGVAQRACAERLRSFFQATRQKKHP